MSYTKYDSYKESAIPWVGEVPVHWSIKPNKWVMHKEKRICEKWNGEEILSLTMNGVIVRNLEAGGKMPSTFDGYQYANEGELLMCLFDIDVTPRCIGRVKQNGITSPAYSAFVMNDKETDDENYFYYYYLMMDNTKELLHLAKNLRHSFTEEQLGALKVPCPPIEEQKAIAEFLDLEIKKIDELISDVKESIALYKEWKSAVIYQAITNGVNCNTALVSSGIEWIGEMSEDISIVRMQDIGEYKKGPFGSAIKKSMFVEKAENTYKVYEQKNAIYKDYSLGYYYIDEDKYEELKDFEVLPGDILVSCAGTIGECYIVPNDAPKGVINQALMRVRLEDTINKEFFMYVFDVVLKYAASKYSNGSAIKNIPPFNILKKIRIPHPTLKMQEEIVKFLDEKCELIDKLIVDKENLVKQLEVYKQSVIYEVVTGKRKVV